MENDFPNPSTSQLLTQHISEAALFTDPVFAITACSPAASALFHYNQQDIKGYSISLQVPLLPCNLIMLLNRKRINKATYNPFMKYSIIGPFNKDKLID